MIRLRRIINNTLISLLGQVVIWTSSLLLTIAYGRLGAFTFGELYLAITLVSLVGFPVDYGYSNQIIREVAQKPDMAPRYSSNLFLIKFGTWLIMYTVMLLISWLLGYTTEVRVLVVICGLDLLCNSIASTFASLHYAFERAIFPVVGNIIEKILSVLFSILVLSAGAGVQAMAVVLVVGSLINVAWQATWFFRLLGTSFVIDLALIRAIVRANIPFFITGVLGVSYTSIDTVLLSQMTNSAVVGWYGAAARIVDSMSFLPGIVMTTVMYPIFSKLSATSDEGLKLAVEKSMNILLFCSIPLTTVLIVAAPNIIGFLYGRGGFIQAIPALQALAPYVVLLYINYVLLTIVLSKRQERKLPIIGVVAVVFNLGLNLILIPLYQHVGSAILTSLTEMLLCCIAVVFIIPRHLLPFGSLRVAFKALIASLVMALAILALHTLPIFVIIPVAMLVYLGASLLLGTIPREDYQVVYRAMRQKAQLTSGPSTNDLPETPLPSYHPDALLDIEFAITMKLPAIRLQSVQHGNGSIPQTPPMLSYPTDALLEDESTITMKLPAIRLQPMRQRPLKVVRLQPMQPRPLTQPGPIVSGSEELIRNNGGTVG